MTFSAKVKCEIASADFENNAKRAELAALFISCGYVNDPVRAYHAEFRLADAASALSALNLLADFDLTPLQLTKRSARGVTLYFKDSEKIGELLCIIGAHRAFLDFENVKIRKSVDNRINRHANFDAANVDKSISAAVRQIECIDIIDAAVGLRSLGKPLEEIAVIRRENPSIPLQELGAKLSPPITKSAANHRLRKIIEIAEKYK
ncbi:MAG: DNA-binding protein WhiA [Defluviitaleaceae bacterium]|nr:DNA-binding protein WhiA [Defluviitaleaceae bacterium]